MSTQVKWRLASGALTVLVVLALVLVYLAKHPVTIRGAVVTSNSNPARELPVGDVEVEIAGAGPSSGVRSDPAGYFQIPVPWHMRRGQTITLTFQHPDYKPLTLEHVADNRLYVAHLVPRDWGEPVVGQAKDIAISNVVVRYSISTTTKMNIGSAVKTFQVVNHGNTACDGQSLCSPDGKWKAVEGSTSLDAGAGNEFQNARASCIAGPCPFTKILDGGVSLSHDGRVVRATALDWSDTATFLLEAEVYKPISSEALRQSYPVVSEQALTFTLPPAADGVSIQAELNGGTIVFPLGPTLFLTWADCQMVVNKDKTRVYRCELKPGYRFE